MNPSKIGRFEIQSELGRGGMAVVYLAFDPRFRRQVAVKVLPDRFNNHPVLRKRFEREAQAIAAIEHPAIVPVYDYGEQDGHLYLVLRYMPGGSLETRLRQGPLPLSTTASIITRIAQALDAVHTRGIVHRDLKPGNILFDSYDNAYIADFGIVHLTEATAALTGEGLVGTPAYMSPEQVQGDKNIDSRSDLYSLGIIVFEMLTGHQPFRAPTPIATAMQHLTRSIPLAHKYQAGLPDEVETLLQTALAKDPASRYQTAEGLAKQLDEIATTFPGGAAPLASPATRPQAETDDLLTVAEEGGRAQPAPGASAPTSLPGQPTAQAPSAVPAHPASIGGTVAPPTQDEQDVSYPASTGQNPSRKHIWVAGGMIGVVALCGVVSLLLLSAILPSIFRGFNQSPPPGDSTQPASVEPSPPSASMMEGGWRLAAEDSFSNPASGWPSSDAPGGSYGYHNEAYLITINQPGDLYWATPSRQAADVRIAVSATFAGGTDQNYFGVVCRLQDTNNYYYFVITSIGDYTIGKLEQGTFSSFLSGGWVYSAEINTGEVTNQLRADCEGDSLLFYVNDVLIREVRDQTFTSGQYGIIAAALAEPGVQIIFDDFVAYTP